MNTNVISGRSLFLYLCDLISIAAAFFLGYFLRFETHEIGIQQIPFLSFSLIIFPVFFYIFDLYHPFKRFLPNQTFVDVAISVFMGIVMSAAASYADRTLMVPRLHFLYEMMVLVPAVYLVRLFYDFVFRSRFLDKRTIILGTGPLACEIVEVIKLTPHSGMEIVGLVYEKRKPHVEQKNGVPILGSTAALLSLLDWYRVQLVILALDPEEEVSETEIMSQLLQRRVMVTSSIYLFEKLTGDFPYKILGNHYLLGLMAQIPSRAYVKIKRIIDIVMAALLFTVFFPVFCLAFLVLAAGGPDKVFFSQTRLGKNAKPFRLVKFRSMTVNSKGKTTITGFGKWMRKYRVDEIPQLLNILKGDMSLVGPRPEIPYFVARSRKKIPFYDAVFTVKPGLTGWAQIRFCHATSVKDYDRKFRYNVYYLKNMSLRLDLQIILQTVRVIIMGTGK